MAQKKKRDKKYRPKSCARNPMLRLVDFAMPIDEEQEVQDCLNLLMIGEKFLNRSVTDEKDFIKASCYIRIGARLASHFEGDLVAVLKNCHEALRNTHKAWVQGKEMGAYDAAEVNWGISLVDAMRRQVERVQITNACELAALELNRPVDDLVGAKLRYKLNGEMYVDDIGFSEGKSSDPACSAS